MCCRYLLTKEHLERILRVLGLDAPPGYASRYNLAPGEAIPVVRAGSRGKPEAAQLRWGLPAPPGPAGTNRQPLVNARAETLAQKPAFREAYRLRRCLVPASGFYEWQAGGSDRLPWVFRRSNGEPFCLAGLWEIRPGPKGLLVEACALITTEPNGLMRPIHSRMPLILQAEQFGAWLDPQARPGDLEPLLRPTAEGALSAERVGTRVNRVGVEGPACLEPPGPEEAVPPQLDLGLG